MAGAWVRTESEMPEHPKILRAGPLATHLHWCALSYCNRNVTDGRLPKPAVPTLVNWDGVAVRTGEGQLHETWDAVSPHELAAILVDVGLWIEHDDEYEIHDYLDFQPSKEKLERDREQRSNAGRASGEARRQRPPQRKRNEPRTSRSRGEYKGGTGSDSATATATEIRDEGSGEKGRTPNLDSHPAVLEAAGRMAEVRGCEFPRSDRVEALLRDFSHLDGPERIASGAEDYWCHGEGRNRKLRDPVKALRMAFEYADRTQPGSSGGGYDVEARIAELKARAEAPEIDGSAEEVAA